MGLLVSSGSSSGMEGEMDSGTVGHVAVPEGWASLSKAPRARADMQMWSSRRVRSHRGSRAVVFEDQAVMDVSGCTYQLEGGGRSQKEKG